MIFVAIRLMAYTFKRTLFHTCSINHAHLYCTLEKMKLQLRKVLGHKVMNWGHFRKWMYYFDNI